MAKAHTDGQYTNPDVRFERADVEMGGVVRFATWLGVVLAVTSGLTMWLAYYVAKREGPRKVTDLPPAAVDDTNVVHGKSETFAPLPPEPRLEALDDVRDREKRSFEMLPHRAAEYYHKQERELADGDKAAGVEPIGEAIKQAPGLLRARKEPAPSNYGVALPSRASAGRTTTGGQ
jgi:hypothetical protein